MIPSDIDLVTASVRWFTSSFWKMLATWGFTLLSLMERAAAMALLGEPLAMSCKTSVFRSGSPDAERDKAGDSARRKSGGASSG
jgi:hypothetical protein